MEKRTFSTIRRRRSHCRVATLLLLTLFGTLAAQEEKVAIRHAGQREEVYAAAGLGILNLERKTGIGVPLGFTLVSSRLRLIGSVNLLDLGFLQDDKQDPRYFRAFSRFGGGSVCFDGEHNRVVSEFRCSGGTDVLLAFSGDLSFIPVETQFFGGKLGKVFTGAGFRLAKPRTLYATIGLFFDTQYGNAGGLKVRLGKDFVFVGVIWGLNLKRFTGQL